MLYVTVYDIKRLPLFRSMFNRESQIEQAENRPLGPVRKPASRNDMRFCRFPL